VPPPKPTAKPAPVDDFTAMLKSLNGLRDPAHGGGAATAAGGAGPGTGRRGSGGGIKDFIRAQIERHWNFDVNALGRADLTVSLHIVLESDGRVRQVDIVDDPRFRGDPAYRPVADSVRRAALVASPLQLPPDADDSFRDLTLSFRPRDVVH
jgi:hypothetical protein